MINKEKAPGRQQTTEAHTKIKLHILYTLKRGLSNRREIL